MIAALLPLLGIHSAFIMGFTSHPQAAFARPTEATHQWLSPSLRRGDEVIYMSGPNGVYIYRRHPALKLAGFLLVQENVVTAGPAIGPNHDLYVVNFNSSTEASVVDEYHRSARGFRLIRQFTQADYGNTLAVGPDGAVYVVGLEGEVLEYAASGGAPVRTLYSDRRYSTATGVAVDGQNNLFVSFQSQPSTGAHVDDGPDVRSGCHRRGGAVVEYRPHSGRGHCVNATRATRRPGNLTFDATGNLLVTNVEGVAKGEITVLTPPTWAVSRVMPAPEIPYALSFGAQNHLYLLNADDHLIERSYSNGDTVGAWWLPQPWAGGLAVAQW